MPDLMILPPKRRPLQISVSLCFGLALIATGTWPRVAAVLILVGIVSLALGRRGGIKVRL